MDSQHTENPKKSEGTLRNARLVGLFFFLGGGGTTYLNWHSVHTSGMYWPMASFLTPIAFFVGLAMLLFTAPQQEPVRDAETEHGVEANALTKMSPAQRFLVGVGVLVGLANWVYMNFIL